MPDARPRPCRQPQNDDPAEARARHRDRIHAAPPPLSDQSPEAARERQKYRIVDAILRCRPHDTRRRKVLQGMLDRLDRKAEAPRKEAPTDGR